MSTNNLNVMGQTVLAAAASFAANGLAHPLCTIQTCLQARSNIPWVIVATHLRAPFLGINRPLSSPLRIPFAGLYRGFCAIYMVDFTSLGVAYIANDLFQRSLGPIGTIFAATFLSTPFVGIGEGAMQNRQSNNLAYRDRELWQRSIRLSGLFMTMVREVFWNLGIFYITPKGIESFHRRWPDSPLWAGQVVVATATGGAVGFLTTPFAVIKTVIQTSRDSLSLSRAIRQIIRPDSNNLRVLRSVEALFSGGIFRSLYLGLFMFATHQFYLRVPPHLPERFKRIE